jgi:MoxR-like ATPase
MKDRISPNRNRRSAPTDRHTEQNGESLLTDGGSLPSEDESYGASSTLDEEADISDPAVLYDRVQEAVDRVLVGNEDVIEGLTIALLTRGHVLLEGVPGVAKTTIANAFSRALGLEYTRIQMTPDVLPTDITGTHVYREPTGEFELRKGPLFGNIILADEINRATPKTQSALLEAMQEQQVTIEGKTLELPSPFCLIATQNPIEIEGTFELPAAQRDRFALKYVVDLPDRDTESAIVQQFDSAPELGPEAVDSVVTAADVLATRLTVSEVYVADPIVEYILDIVHKTRADHRIEHGGSPRASLVFLNAAKARAAIHGRKYVLPDDIKALVKPVLSHRIVRNTDARMNNRSTTTILNELVDSLPVPDSEIDYSPDGE